ncbi:hypothetical protein C8A00DRAFT_38004 [Chaetomidium leptoderma]|uniref:Uncharacterized protein n=1 Tax=Chaetomidium leptoderma TaxID=669021 RepID=A0AAN6VDJ5_9PEZI|nr:hypothetical protein C8A00DRAFT_38004 [Chaetomidium leptoderma]
MSTKSSLFWSKVRQALRRNHNDQVEVEEEQEEDVYIPQPDDYPTFPPLPPRDLFQDPTHHFNKIAARKFGGPQGEYEDKPLYALYRFYEFVVLDNVTNYRNCLEAFWRQKGWPVDGIPDPEDPDPERYAFLAGCTFLMARAFNARVKLGLDRNMPSLLIPEEAEALRNRPHHLRNYEKVPEWAEKVAPLEELLVVPTHEGEVLTGKEDKRADPDFLDKGILLWTPHIFFT